MLTAIKEKTYKAFEDEKGQAISPIRVDLAKEHYELDIFKYAQKHFPNTFQQSVNAYQFKWLSYDVTQRSTVNAAYIGIPAMALLILHKENNQVTLSIAAELLVRVDLMKGHPVLLDNELLELEDVQAEWINRKIKEIETKKPHQLAVYQPTTNFLKPFVFFNDNLDIQKMKTKPKQSVEEMFITLNHKIPSTTFPLLSKRQLRLDQLFPHIKERGIEKLNTPNQTILKFKITKEGTYIYVNHSFVLMQKPSGEITVLLDFVHTHSIEQGKEVAKLLNSKSLHTIVHYLDLRRSFSPIK